jgi:MinD superfamily P-loop ATPase
VEAPNLHLFLHPDITEKKPHHIMVPEVDEEKCTRCRACADICQFSAINILGDVIFTAEEMCHGCGGCLAVCPEGAILAGKREVGEILRGNAGSIPFIGGRLRIGEAMSPPLIRAVKKRAFAQSNGKDVLMDAPPGVSCPAVTSALDADFMVMVTEPTPFGLHDLKLAWSAFSEMGLALGVVVNRDGIGNDEVHEFCKRENLTVLAKIPYSTKAAEQYAAGRPLSEHEEFAPLFADLEAKIRESALSAICARRAS